MMIAPKLSCTAIFLAAALPLLAQSQQGGDLAPGAAPGVTMKSLAQIDPGTALDPADFGAAGITISSPGSYYLTGNVTTVPGTTPAITVDASDVTIDLRGFGLIAPSGTGTMATQSAIFVSAALPARENVSVRNGTIQGSATTGQWGGGVYGINNIGAVYENLRVRGTNGFGLVSASDSLISNCRVSNEAGGFGIFAETGSIVRNCTVFSGGFAIAVGDDSSVVDCVVHGAVGIDAGNHARISGCIAANGAGNGIDAGNGSVVSGCVSYGNSGSGFSLGFSSTISGCTSWDNSFDGFIVSSQGRIDGCVAFSNGAEGFDLVSNIVATGCIAMGNDDNGFSASAGSIFSNCVSSANGQAAGNNAADGFELVNVNRIRDCSVFNNEGAGVRATSTLNDIRDSLIYSNDSGGIDLTADSNLVIGNYMPANSSFNVSPAPAGGIGPFETPFSGTSPNANFQ